MDTARLQLQQLLQNTPCDEMKLYNKIVNDPFTTVIPVNFDIGTIVLLIDNDETGFIERVALSQTPAGLAAASASAVPFNEIKIPRDYKLSTHVKALEKKTPVITSDWYGIFRPVLSAEHARDNQQSAGIQTSVIQPFFGKKKRGTLIYSLYIEPKKITNQAKDFFSWYAGLVSEII